MSEIDKEKERLAKAAGEALKQEAKLKRHRPPPLEPVAVSERERIMKLIAEEGAKQSAILKAQQEAAKATELKTKRTSTIGKGRHISIGDDSLPRRTEIKIEGDKKTVPGDFAPNKTRALLKGLDIGQDALNFVLKWVDSLVKASASLPLNGVIAGLLINSIYHKLGLIDTDDFATTQASLHNVMGVDVTQRKIDLVSSVIGLIPIVGGLTMRPPPDLLLTATLSVNASSDIYSRPELGARTTTTGPEGEFTTATQSQALLALLKLIEKVPVP